MHPRLLRLKEVMARTGLSRSMIYELIGKDQFPSQLLLTERCVGWVEDEVHDWILKRLEAAKKLSTI